MTELLQALKKCGHPELPNGARKFLNAPKKINIETLGSGSYVHYGLEKAIVNQLKSVNKNLSDNEIRLQIHIDGLQRPTKKKNCRFWDGDYTFLLYFFPLNPNPASKVGG